MFEKFKLPKSSTLVVFGATGDLTHRKILPAIYRLHKNNNLPECFSLVAVARRDKDTNKFKHDTKISLEKFIKKPNKKFINDVLDKIYYYKTDFDTNEGYSGLNEFLDELDKTTCTKSNRIYYMATQPKHFGPIVSNLKKFNIVDRSKNRENRIVIEKPFGYDTNSATKLNKTISAVFKENEIFRIDHYLGKESVQNLFALRFANRMFEPVWNNKHIENIQIVASESLGVESRAGYYDKSGALRDMVQNHLLQLLSLVAMEPPVDFSNKNIKDEKVKVLKSINVCSGEDIKNNVVLGQYKTGKTGLDYTSEDGVYKNSRTETYVAMKICIQNKRWKDVPFYLKTGKNLKRKSTEIVIYFKNELNKVFSHLPNYKPNVLVIRLQPNEGIYLRFNIKEPGNEFNIQRVSMDFCHDCLFGAGTPEAYEKLIYHMLIDDASLFTRWDEVKEAWRIIDPIEKYWSKSGINPAYYESGTWGPVESEKLLNRSGHHWRLREDKE